MQDLLKAQYSADSQDKQVSMQTYMSKMAEQVASLKNENSRLELKMTERELALRARDHEEANRDVEINKMEMDLRRAKKQIEVYELASKGKGRGWLGFGGGGGADAEGPKGNDDTARWQHAAQVYATKLAEAEANIKNLQMVVADINEERREAALRLSPMRGRGE